MLEKCRNAKDRWGGVSDVIDQWLEQRGLLIRSLVNISDCEIGQPLNEYLDQFCGLLLDYLSSGHFGVYEQILNEWEGSSVNAGSERPHALFPLIKQTTDVALDFNDHCHQMENLTLSDMRLFLNKLNQLGESLEERFRLEDLLIDSIYRVQQAKKNKV